MSVAIETLERLQEEAGLRTDDVARVTRSSRRTVERWRAGVSDPPASTKELLLYVAAAVRQARKYMTKDQAWAWLHSPNPYLDNNIPLDVLGSDYKRVLNALEAEAEGVYI
jgi:uncharacterized protein (DUF2384 family)